MSGSAKGRVLLNQAARPSGQRDQSRIGICAWCGEACYGPKDPPIVPQECLRCQSPEIDWIPSPLTPRLPITPHQHFRDLHTPGSVALVMLGGIFRAYR